MPRPNSGLRLKLRKQNGAQPIWEIVCYEQGRRRTRSTGTGSRQEAEKALARLLWAARNVSKSRTHLPLYILLGMYTGARKKAILELQWSQVDMENGVIDYHVPGSRRTKKRRARIPIPRGLMHALRRAKRRSNGAGTVIEYHGEPVGDIKKSFSSAASAAGFEDVTPHTLRHTAITWLVQKGVKLWEVSGYVGASVETIQRTYGHHAPDYLENARKAME